MDVVLILISWLILLVPGFDDSVPVTSDKVFKIETSPDIIQSITTRSDESLDFLGFDVKLKQNSTGILEIKIPKNLPTPASFTNSWHHAENPIMLTDGAEIGYDVIPDPCYSHYKIPVEDETNLEILYPVILIGSWQLYSPIQFDENHSCYDKVFYEKYLESPLKQINSGTALFDIRCSEEKSLVYKYNRMRAACVNSETETELIDRGWALMRLGFPGYARADLSSSLCGNYGGKWHPEHNGCRGDISDLQCSLMGGIFVDNLKICYNDICPENKTYTLCVTNSDESDSEPGSLPNTDIHQEKTIPSDLKRVLDSCNSTGMQPTIGYRYSNGTHTITNNLCEWQTLGELENEN